MKLEQQIFIQKIEEYRSKRRKKIDVFDIYLVNFRNKLKVRVMLTSTLRTFFKELRKISFN